MRFHLPIHPSGPSECLCVSGKGGRLCVNIINTDPVKCIHTVMREELWLLMVLGF